MPNMIGSSSAFDRLMGSSILDEVRQLIPEIAGRADEIEKARAVPMDLLRKLQKAGAFRTMIPKFYGGPELHPLAAIRIIEELAYADGSVGWTGMVALGFNLMLCRYPRATTDKLFANGPDVLVRGAGAPQGVAVPKDGGFVISGRWPLASGNYDYAWILANTLVMEDGKPRKLPNGMPEMRACLLPADQATFLDTWDAVGLRGTSSHDFVIEDAFVPESMTASLFGDQSTWDTPIHHLPFILQTGNSHCAVGLGLAQGALDDLAYLAKTKRPALGGGAKLADDAMFKGKLGELAGRLAIVRDATYSDQLKSYDIGVANRPATPVELYKSGAVTSLVHAECMKIIDDCVTLSGSTGIYSKSTIQRRWRDMRTVCQHAGGLGMSAMRYQGLAGALMEDVAAARG